MAKDCLVLSTVLTRYIGHSRETRVMAFRALALLRCRLSLLLVLVLAPRVFLRVRQFSSLY